MVGDVNGDGRSDAVARPWGIWKAALSTGGGFSTPTNWGGPNGGSGHERCFLADMNGDGKADFVRESGSTWYVGLSTGTTFPIPTKWGKFRSGISWNDYTPLVADVNGDLKADVVGVMNNGEWWVQYSNGSSIATAALWKTSLGADTPNVTTKRLVGDVNGDLKADAVAVVNGNWRVALSSGTAFGADASWIPSHGAPVPGVTTTTLLADVNRDGSADAIAVENGTWKVALASNGIFGTPSTWTTTLGVPSQGTTIAILAGDVTSDGTPDAIAIIDGAWNVGVATPILDRIKGPGSAWSMTFSDEFNGATLAAGDWRVTRADPLATGPNNPYSDKEGAKYWPQNVSFNGQSMVETIRVPGVQGPSYSTGSVNTFGLHSFTYGYFEASIQPPACAGCWPAFWLLPSNTVATYPPELDIFEFFPNVNGGLQPYFNSHWGTWPSDLRDLKLMNGGMPVLAATGANYAGSFHTFGLLWTPHDIQPFVDGVGGRVFTGPAVPQQAMYLINTLQQAAKDPNENPYVTPDNVKMETDYIRYYEMPPS